MRIVFVRHGEPDYVHDCLTDLGHLQAAACAQRLKEEGISRIYASPMGRARQTAQATAQVLGMDIQILDFMHEIYWGSVDGSPLFANGHPWDLADRLVREGWDLTRTDWPEHAFYRNNLATAEVEKISKGADDWLMSLGYRREGTYYRCLREKDEPFTVALFSHGGSSTAALSRILGLPFPYLCGFLHMPFTSLFIVRLEHRPGEISLPVLELAGDAKHIEGLQPPRSGFN